jgi:integrase
VLRLSKMNASTRAATINSVRIFRSVVAADGNCLISQFAQELELASQENRRRLGDRHSQIISDCRRALRAWNDDAVRNMALRLRGRLPTLTDASVAAGIKFEADKARRIQNAIRDLAAFQCAAPSAIVATSVIIEPILRAATPENFRVETRKALDNKRGYIRTAVKLVDPEEIGDRTTYIKALPTEFRTLLDRLEVATPEHAKSVRAIFRRLLLRAEARGLGLRTIDANFMVDFVAYEKSTKATSHVEKLRHAARIWASVTENMDIGVPEIEVMNTRHRLPDVQWSDVPAGIREPIDRLIGTCITATGDDDWAEYIMDDEDDLLGLSELGDDTKDKAVLMREPGTMKNWRDAVKRAWHAALQDPTVDRKPAVIADLCGKDVLLALVRAVRKSRQFRLEKQGQKWEGNEKGRYECSMVQALISVAKVLEVEESSVQQMTLLSHKLDPSIIGKKVQPDGSLKHIYEDRKIGKHHADMLVQFQNQNALKRWFTAPQTLWTEAEKWTRYRKKPTMAHASLARSALVAQITQRVSPMRRTNLCRLRISADHPHIQIPLNNGEGTLQLPAREMKNLRSVFVKIDIETVNMIQRFIDVYRPILMLKYQYDPSNEHLFPGAETDRKERGSQDGYPKGFGYQLKDKLRQRFKAHMTKYCMLEMDLQVMRHIAGKVILDMDPSAMGLVQELLGHKKIETTRSYYAEVCKIVAQQHYLGLLDKYTRRVLTNVDFRVKIEDELARTSK